MLAGSTGKHIAIAGRLGNGPALGPSTPVAGIAALRPRRQLRYCRRAVTSGAHEDTQR
jgi:hypothetical protein